MEIKTIPGATNTPEAIAVSPNYKGKNPKTMEQLAAEREARRAKRELAKANGERIKTLNNVDKHKQLCKRIHELYVKKNHDYGNSFHNTYEQLGIVSAVTRITDKYNRIVSLSTNTEQKVKDESIVDSLIDIANYALMTVAEIEGYKND